MARTNLPVVSGSRWYARFVPTGFLTLKPSGLIL
jgi:hypothetical protein